MCLAEWEGATDVPRRVMRSPGRVADRVCSHADSCYGAEDETDADARITVDADSVTVECADTAPRPTRPVGVVGAPVPCRWVSATAANGWDPGAYGDISQSGYVFFESASGEIGRRFPDGREEMVFNRVCPDGASGFTWVDTTVTVQDAIDDAVDRARRAVPLPGSTSARCPRPGEWSTSACGSHCRAKTR